VAKLKVRFRNAELTEGFNYQHTRFKVSVLFRIFDNVLDSASKSERSPDLGSYIHVSLRLLLFPDLNAFQTC